jgi:hypothetical protein
MVKSKKKLSHHLKEMDIQGFASIPIQPGPIGQAFSYSNIILDTAVTPTSTQYLIPSASDLLQRFSGLNGQGLSICKPGDVWSKRYIMKRNEAVTISSIDSSGAGSVAITAGIKVVNVYLLWLTVTLTTPGDPNTLNGTYYVLSDQPVATTALTSAIVEDWDMVSGDSKQQSSTDSKTK